MQTGALTTTFTASQGLLLMIPNLYKIAGELTSTVIHVAARSIATQALSIFGDHQDVMAARQTGWAMLASSIVQEAQDLALIAHAARWQRACPFIHFFDGFRTSHEVMKFEQLVARDDLRALINDDLVRAHRAARPESRPARSSRHRAKPGCLLSGPRNGQSLLPGAARRLSRTEMDRFASRVGRHISCSITSGAPDAERVMVLMGSGAERREETVRALNASAQKVGVLKVRLYRPFSLITSLPHCRQR